MTDDIREKAIEAAADQLQGYVAEVMATEVAAEVVAAYESVISGGFLFGDRVRKKSNTEWHGAVTGLYVAFGGRPGVVVESERERGSAHIYPSEAMERFDD